MFEDVHLPTDISWKERISNFFENDLNTNKEVLKFLLPQIAQNSGLDFEIPGVSAHLQNMIGVKKPIDVKEKRTETNRKAMTMIVNDLIKNDINDAEPCEGYRYFGTQDYTKILPMLCQTNAFWGAALTSSGCANQYLELKAYSEDEPSDSDSKFLKVMRTMVEELAQHRRVNVRFNKDMTVNQVVSYVTGKAVIVPEEEWNEYMSAATYNVFYFTNIMHSLIHVYHYYMCASITHATKGNKALAAWSDPYDDNIAIKYYEVCATLFHVESSAINVRPNERKIHTGRYGLGGTKEVMVELREWLCIWGGCKNADDFTKKFLLKDLYDTAKDPEQSIKDADLLTEFRKHLDLVDPFTTELTDALKKNDVKAYETAEESLITYLKGCGEGLVTFDSISAWVASMSCTGLLHGGTLGYSRMFVMPEIMRWRDITIPEFNHDDYVLMRDGTGVLAGRTDGRHVFTSEIDLKGQWDTTGMTPEVKAVLKKYDDTADALQQKYKNEIEKREDFIEYGWILTEHGPDGYDGKQHTLTAYI